MEHLNRRLKTVIRSMGANVSPNTIKKVGKAIAPVHHVCQMFEQQTAPSQHSGHHAIAKFGRDYSSALLENEQVFVNKGERKHLSYKFKCTLLEKNTKQEIEKKVGQTLKKLYFL